MNRRAVIVPVLLLAGASTGCSMLSDNDAAARVGELELSQDQLSDLLVAATPPPVSPTSVRDGETARSLLTTWIITRIIEVDLAAKGESVSDQTIADVTGAFEAQDPGWSERPVDLQTLQIEQQAVITTWLGLQPPALPDDELRAIYDAGTEESGFVCSAHILVETEAAAADVLDRLEGGAAFAELAESESVDTASGADGGNLPCDLTGNFETAYVPEFVEAALSADIGVPVGPVQSEFGYHIILLRPSDQIDPSELATLYNDDVLRFERAASAVDIYVDPRFGSFSTASGVVALG